MCDMHFRFWTQSDHKTKVNKRDKISGALTRLENLSLIKLNVNCYKSLQLMQEHSSKGKYINAKKVSQKE